jgi:hypothetical protein
MRLRVCVPAPAIERIVKRHAGSELGEIILIHSRKAQRSCKETFRLWRQIGPCCIGAAHNRRQTMQGFRVEPELFDHGVEGAGFAAMAPEHVVDVKGRCAEPLRHREHFRRAHEQKHGAWIDKAPDQPRAGNPVNLGPRPCDPDGPSIFVACRKLVRINKELATSAPGVEAALQRLRIDAFVAQPRGNPLAKLQALLATHDNCAVLKLVRPIGDGGGVAPV